MSTHWQEQQRLVIRKARSPSIETHFAVVRGLPTKKFQTECVNEKSSTSVAAKVVRPTDLLNNVRY